MGDDEDGTEQLILAGREHPQDPSHSTESKGDGGHLPRLTASESILYYTNPFNHPKSLVSSAIYKTVMLAWVPDSSEC